MKLIWILCAALISIATLLQADALPKSALEPYVTPPMSIGDQLTEDGVWELLNSGGAVAGYVFETQNMAPLPGFSGAPINMLVVLDLDGRFLDVRLLSHNEPIFVSGLGEAPFHAFFEQYRGLSISDSLVVGTPYGGASDGSALIYLDGVTKATASIRIAHESLLAATLKVAREKMQGVSAGPPAYPDPSIDETLTWDDLDGIAHRLQVTNAEVNQAFEGTKWQNDDPVATANPDDLYLDLWVIDIGPPSVARAVLDDNALDELQAFMAIADMDEPILVIDAGRHGLITDDFIRNTAPDLISAEQSGFPIALRDADILVGLSDDAPAALQDAPALILRTDRRLGFDPTTEWTIQIKALREHGVFQPEIGSTTFETTVQSPERFYIKPTAPKQRAPWEQAILDRSADLVVLGLFLAALVTGLGLNLNRLAGAKYFTAIRLTILAFVMGFIGWWGQGQLSIATPLAIIRTATSGGSFAFLLYDPFSLLIWAIAIFGFALWGRGLFCGWLCPFGAMQEFAHHLGRILWLPTWNPSSKWDDRLKWIKYGVLALLVVMAVSAPAHLDTAIEVEPFKTAVTTFFIREWYYVVYAAGLLILSMVTFKGFCRYVCPLGAVMAIGGLIRGREWIARRAECGSPCQLCRVKCNYDAIRKDGSIQYSECFQCLDCVTIHDDPTKCVPLILQAKKQARP
ncbi:4Fe-4S binding protein [Marivivens niveibacter]|nr:4Fe-4S binding protein [Marivivens niveibacter]